MPGRRPSTGATGRSLTSNVRRSVPPGRAARQVAKSGITATIASLPAGLRNREEAVAETIENNVRRKIIKEHLTDPAYYDKMSQLLGELIAERKAGAIEYEAYLKKIAELAKQVAAGKGADTPVELDTPGKRALYNNLDQDRELALKLDAVVREARPDGWRGVTAKEQVVKGALYGVLQDHDEVERVFKILLQQREY